MQRKNISSGARWETLVGYSRAVRVGPHVHVSGTVGNGADAYAQAVSALSTIGQALAASGAKLSDVVRTRIYLTDISQWQLVAKAHAEVFGNILPATSMLEVSRLIGPEYVVEIEAEAYIG